MSLSDGRQVFTTSETLSEVVWEINKMECIKWMHEIDVLCKDMEFPGPTRATRDGTVYNVMLKADIILMRLVVCSLAFVFMLIWEYMMGLTNVLREILFGHCFVAMRTVDFATFPSFVVG